MTIIGSRIELPDNDENLIKVKEKYGKTHEIEAVKGTSPLLAKLLPNQSVCWGDGDYYHFRLTKIESTNNP